MASVKYCSRNQDTIFLFSLFLLFLFLLLPHSSLITFCAVFPFLAACGCYWYRYVVWVIFSSVCFCSWCWLVMSLLQAWPRWLLKVLLTSLCCDCPQLAILSIMELIHVLGANHMCDLLDRSWFSCVWYNVGTLILLRKLFRSSLCWKISCCFGALLDGGQSVQYLVDSDLFLLLQWLVIVKL